MKKFLKLSKPTMGDQVAVVSPSAGLPGLFPWVQDLGVKRLKEKFGLSTKEYPTTRQMGASLVDRATDLMTAFSDPKNKAVISTIGGDDQIKLIKYLDPNVFLSNPKPFFGYSDNTHFHNFLWNLGIPSFYGGGVMTEFAFNVAIPELTEKYLHQALFKYGEIEVESSSTYNDIGLDWSIEENLSKPREFEPNEGLFWDGDSNVEGILWGGCVESLILQSSSSIYFPSNEDLSGCILFIETAEDIPEHWIVEYLLTGFGEKGLFDVLGAVLVGRPKAWEFDKPNSKKKKQTYREEQRSIIVKTIREYNEQIPIVQNLDFGHTAPQIVMPYGGMARIDGQSKKIWLHY